MIADGVYAKVLDFGIASSNERFNLRLYPISGAEPVALTHLAELSFYRGVLTSDGRSVVAARGLQQRDAFVITNFR